MYKKPCHGDNTVGRIRDIEMDKKGRIYIITDEPESALWRISKWKKLSTIFKAYQNFSIRVINLI